MTVIELRELLKDCPDDYLVYESYGEIKHFKVNHEKKYIDLYEELDLVEMEEGLEMEKDGW